MNLASIPSPSDGVWDLGPIWGIGPIPIRAYAIAIIVGIVVAIWVGERRFVARGGRPGTVSDVAVWAIPFGLVGARVYHVATNPEFYFGDGKDPVQALYVWEGGLGIWGAIAFGALGAYLGCRFSGVRFTSYIDAVAPGVVLAQAIGRWGNYFNQELMGKPSDRPWAVEIDSMNRPVGYEQYDTFHPTFLYESLWCIGVAIVLILADRRWKLGRGRVFALYVALYTAGRAWIEDLRIDDAHEFGPFRLNVWVSLAIFVLAVGYFVVVGRRWPGREESVLRPGAAGDSAAEADEDGADDGDSDAESDAEGEDDAEDKAESDDKEKAEAGDKDKAAAEDEVDEKKAPADKAEDKAEPEADDKAEPEADDSAGDDSDDAKSDADRSDDSDRGSSKSSSAAGSTGRSSAMASSKASDSASDSPASSSGSPSSTRSSGSDSGSDSSDSFDSSPSDY